ncbi:MAG: RnfABCDGE type electron transport complex subunit D [Gammaproteobacteria bacterium]|nr:RnfABCDGE type electron transport complex subunit D [Gammaproteobacteria bacterium]
MCGRFQAAGVFCEGVSEVVGAKRFDPRYYQLAVQCALLLVGALSLQFTIPWQNIVAVLVAALLTQWGFLRVYGLPLQTLSAFNTGFSIIILLYAAHWGWLALAACMAIASKFLIRFHGRHVFNPSNLGIVAVLLATDAAWVAHGKWGQALWLGLLLAGFGLVWLLGWRQMLTSLVFMGVYAGLLLARAAWLGDPWAIPLHQLQNGALLIFTFFMLSDPMTTPQSVAGRILFGTWVAVLGWVLQFGYFIPNAFLYALVVSSPLVLLINGRFAGAPFHWPVRSQT